MLFNILLGLLAKTLNMPEDEIKSRIYKEDSEELKDDALQVALDLDAERISRIKETHKTEKADQYARAKKEVSSDWEKKIKAQFNLETDKIGDELIAEAVQKVSSGDGDGDGELTDDKVKAHPLFIKLQNDLDTEVKQLNEDWQKKLEETQNGFEHEKLRSYVNNEAIRYIKGKNPVLPEDQAKAQKRLSVVTKDLSEYDFEKQGDKIIVKTKEGHQLVDRHDKPVSFEQLVESIGGDYFDFNDDGGKGGKGSTGNKNKFGDKKFDRVTVPKDAEELKNAMRNAETPEEREAITKAWNESQESE